MKKSQIKTFSPEEYKEPNPFSSVSWELSLQPLFEQNLSQFYQKEGKEMQPVGTIKTNGHRI